MSINNGRITDRGWEFSDNVTYEVLNYDQESLSKVTDDYPGAFKPNAGGQLHPTGLGVVPGSGGQEMAAQTQVQGKGLVIRLAATHAGLVTRNNGFYMPDKMRDGAKTFIDLYPKPIQVHHEDHMDPVGRVIDSRYVETIGQVADRFKNHVLRDSRKRDVGRADLEFWKDFCGSDKSFIEKLQMIKIMDNVLMDKHYRGVGYIELTADITDPNAIQKVLDGRFLTGSVGAVSDKAVCSICNTNWLEDEHCGHRPGKVYDGKKCFVVAGSLEYDEYSFVNTPADRHSGVISIESGQVLDSVKNGVKDKSLFFYPIADYFHEEDSAMDKNTTETESEAKVEDATQASEEEVVETTAEPGEEAQAETSVKDAAEGSAESGTEGSVKDDSSEENKIEDAQQEVHPAELVMEKLFVEDQAFSESDEDALYDFMMAEVTEDFEDAKLSTEARKKLPASAFCGPDRSFPVNDCAHYTAAKRLLSRYKGPGDKSAIQNNIERKGKALGCSDQKKDSAEAKVEDAVEETKTFSLEFSHEFTGEMNDELSVNIANELLAKLSDELGSDAVETAAASRVPVKTEELEAQVAETHRLEDQVGDLRDQLGALRQELRASYEDIGSLTDQLVNANTKLRDQKVARLETLHHLEGTFTDDVKGGLVKLSDEVLDNSLEMLSSKVDMAKIADKVNDGLSRTPLETVDNPTEVTMPSVTEEIKDQVDTKPTYQTQALVDAEYRRRMLDLRDPVGAKTFYKDAVTKGLAKPKPGLDT